MKSFIYISAAASLTVAASAQNSLPRTIEPADRALLSKQAMSFAKSVTPVVKEVSKSVVSIQVPSLRSRKWQTISLGTVTDKGIVTKWSEVAPYMRRARIIAEGKPARPIKLMGVYQDYDLALLSDEEGLPTIKMDNLAPAEIGDFIVLSGTSGQPAGFGTVSVKERSLRRRD